MSSVTGVACQGTSAVNIITMMLDLGIDLEPMRVQQPVARHRWSVAVMHGGQRRRFASHRNRSKPIATVENGRDAVVCCLLMREAVYTKQVATMEQLKAGRG